MSWIDDLTNFGGDMIDMVGEVGGKAVDAYVTTEVSNRKEANSQPEAAKQREPVKGVNVDGSTIVNRGYQSNPLNPQIIQGVSNQVLMLAGLGLIALFALGKG